MFTLLGLYDWKEIITMYDGEENNSAEGAFYKGIITLKKVLPYYDIGGFSAYDLGFKTFENEDPHIGVAYHAVHITQLYALYSVTNEEMLKEYEMKWRQYVD